MTHTNIAPSENVEISSRYLDDIKRLVDRTFPPSPIENHHDILIYIKVSNYLIFFHYIFANN